MASLARLRNMRETIGAAHFGLRIAPTHRELLVEVKAEKLARLMSGTSLERISDESVTCVDSGFVRPNIWTGGPSSPPHAESPFPGSLPIGDRALTFAARVPAGFAFPEANL